MTVKPAPPPAHVDEAETIRLLVNGPAVPCDGSRRTCPNTAVWGMDCLTCGNLIRACEAHRSYIDRRIEHGVRMDCTVCDNTYPSPLPWVPL